MRQITDDLEREQWHDFLERVTREHTGDDASIEVASEEFGDQCEAQRLPLAYVEFDHKDDVVIVGLGGRDGRYPVVLEHVIHQPRAIVANEVSPEIPLQLRIVANDGIETLVTLFGAT